MTKILGLGNALVDIMIQLPDDKLLDTFGLPKGSMQHVERKVIDEILRQTTGFHKQLSSGGSAANAIHGLAKLGASTSFIGKIGHDYLGQLFYDDMILSGIFPRLLHSSTETGSAAAFISADSERTFAVFLGAALELNEKDLAPEMFAGYEILHIEGYLVQNQNLISSALKMAKDNGLKVSLDMASYNVVADNVEFLRGIVGEYIDILFANEQEAFAFTGLEPIEAAGIFADHCEIAVVKTGSDGSLVQRGATIHYIDVLPVKVLDTTGAGDLYAAGFLHGLIHGKSLDKCGRAGAILAGNVIQHLGAKIPDKNWEEIRMQIASL